MNARRFNEFIQRWRTVMAELPDRRTGDNTQFEMGHRIHQGHISSVVICASKQ